MLVGRVPRQHFIGEREAFRRHDQRDDHLHAITALVAAVTVPAFVLLIGRRIGLEIGARQVVQQDIERGSEKVLPTLAEMTEQRRLVRHHLIQAAIQ